MTITKHRYEPGNEAAWLELRSRLQADLRLGGSELGVAAGLSPYKSRFRLWAERKGLIEVPDLSGREPVRVGKDLEDYVARRFAEVSGKTVHRENCIFVNDACPHLFASIDRKVANEDSGLECKTANAMRARDFEDDVFPATYYAQVCGYLAVTGLKRWYLAVLVMGVKFCVYCMTTDPADLDAPAPWVTSYRLVSPAELGACEGIAADFFAEVAQDMPNAYDGSDDECDAVKAAFPRSGVGKARNLSATMDELLDERAVLQREVASKEARIQGIENELRMWLGEDELAKSPKWKVTWKTSKASSKTDWRAVAGECNPDYETVKKFTVEKPGARVLRISAQKSK